MPARIFPLFRALLHHAFARTSLIRGLSLLLWVGVLTHRALAQGTDVARYNPVADPAATVLAGHARFTVLTPQLIRMEWSAENRFEDRPSLVFLNRRMPVPAFEQRIERGVLHLHTASVDLTYDTRSRDAFTAANLQIKLRVANRIVTWRPGDSSSGNLMGTTRTLDNAVGEKTLEPMEQGLISRDGWALVDDSARPLFDADDFTFAKGEKSPWPWVIARSPGAALDWYFFAYGHAYRQALGDFVQVAGRIPLPPRFAFGSWWSRYWAYSDEDLKTLVHSFQQNTTPLDVLVVDMDWHKTVGRLAGERDQSGHLLGWSGYTWDNLLFPHPAELLDDLHREGVKVTLNLHEASGIQPWEEAYPNMAKALKIDPETRHYVPANFTDKRFTDAAMEFVHHPLEKQGVDFWWLDWQQESTTGIANLNPTWWLNYVHFTDQQREGKRPLLFHRWGGLGNHRYQIGFSGDTYSTWDSLAFQPWFTATAANVGYAYWSHDIGGHIPGEVDPELYTRWVQFGVLSPILRTHTTKAADGERRPWAYPEPYSDIMRGSYRWRLSIEPYLYTEARKTYDTGVAFLHPLYYDWPEESAAYNTRNEYVFGSSLIAAPIVKPIDPESKLASQTVWIPPGEWIETSTGTRLQGPTQVERSFSLDQTPLYAAAGAIIPMQPEMQATGQLPVDPLIATIYPLQQSQRSSYTLYEDGGNAEAYQHGECAWTGIQARQMGDDLTVEFVPARGTYPGMLQERRLRVVLPADWPPTSVTVNGAPLDAASEHDATGWHYDGDTLSTIATTRAYPVSEDVVIVFHRESGMLRQRALLNGFPGSIARLKAALGLLNASWPAALPPNVLIEAAQTGDRIGYRPASAKSELISFWDRYREAQASVEELRKKASLTDSQLIDHVAVPGDMEKIRKSLPLFRTGVIEATALLKDGQPAGDNAVLSHGSKGKPAE
ncbi:alpha-glucosidase [Granulicella rosea]|uniref:Alpha-glucosidase n=1 Tax=Granulicella rosea TaxID=474952 RepID=A0A239LY86_9BACT|nr:TIM-barrel domain-containing protein [Granulicella rosea]SNT34659.1 alpha-glucosidase [Granulicella rosea]